MSVSPEQVVEAMRKGCRLTHIRTNAWTFAGWMIDGAYIDISSQTIAAMVRKGVLQEVNVSWTAKKAVPDNVRRFVDRELALPKEVTP